MDNLARKLELELELERWEQGELVQQVGTVVRAEGVALRVRTETGEYGARRAVSCLVQPELDDEVLVACRASGACYVLAVLEREPGAATTLQVEGDLQVQVPAGSFGADRRAGGRRQRGARAADLLGARHPLRGGEDQAPGG